ncbi:NAD(P)/FAD-dependent oxidoreductase [Streptomyces sp. NPDC005820]|uniref:flavin-containing monooxygenase n=1 Tax=Streptomyces sp. NPDC005820 TaxID=3157069 RepID=UPI0033C18D9B
MSANRTTGSTRTPDREVVIIGAGFGGLSTLYHAREAGLDVVLLEAGTEVGGTWYWNTYPGACTDTEAWCYSFSFAREELSEWRWTHRFPMQKEVQGYLNFVADRLDLKKYIQFSTGVRSLRYDESENLWTVTTADGGTLVARYVVTAVGGLSKPYLPDIPGRDSFSGETLLTARWPKAGIDLAGKRVALVGTASTGVQILPELAATAKEVHVFQRTPNYVLPRRNHVIDDMHWSGITAHQEEIWQKVWKHYFAFPLPLADRVTTDVTPEERERIFEEKWAEGGFSFSFSTFDDLNFSEEANEHAAEFIRRKIRQTVQDPETAELLCPKDYPYGAKRPPVHDNYYETFNRANVHLVDVGQEPISEITSTAVRVGEAEYEVDVIVFATGFDALTGAIGAIEVVGRDGRRLDEHWSQGVRTHTGLASAGFPNLLYVYGPQTPHANIPPTVQKAGRWAIEAVTYLRANGMDYIEAESEAEEKWRQEVRRAVEETIFPRTSAQARAWFMGANVPGKRPEALVYMGGADRYYAELDELEANGYPGFVLRSREPVTASTALGG